MLPTEIILKVWRLACSYWSGEMPMDEQALLIYITSFALYKQRSLSFESLPEPSPNTMQIADLHSWFDAELS